MRSLGTDGRTRSSSPPKATALGLREGGGASHVTEWPQRPAGVPLFGPSAAQRPAVGVAVQLALAGIIRKCFFHVA